MKESNTMGGRTARACDGCLRSRARWFCQADDAFLCQSCDTSVHSANQLASRHERVRLETASSKTNSSSMNTSDSPPSWHQGFTRKARTPRHSSNKSLLVQQHLKDDEEKILNNPLPLVPEIGSEEEGNMGTDESEDRLLYRVPVFDPFARELCDMLTSEEEINVAVDGGGEEETCRDLENFSGFLPSDVDLAEFAADMENLLGKGLEDDDDGNSPAADDDKNNEENDLAKYSFQDKKVKVKDEEETEAIGGCSFDQLPRESLNWNFDSDSPVTGDEEQEEKVVVAAGTAAATVNGGNKREMKRNISLRLNYEAVITAWASQGSPWASGSRPILNPDHNCWPDCMGACPKHAHHQLYGGLRGHAGGGDGEREARVMRYKEKRRTRLFSKKIRYEVRKLNAEKRPRMKGRFVKRTAFNMATAFPNYIGAK